jgi:syntaxin-binding protein 1
VNPPSRWKILVVDDHSQKLIGSVLKQNDILQESVTSMWPSVYGFVDML